MPIIGTRSAWAIALAAARPTRMPVNRPGTDVDGDRADLRHVDVGLLAHELDRGHQRLGVAAAAAHLEHGQHALVPADRHADLLGGRLDAEDQHRNAASRRSISSQRAAHDLPVGADDDVAGILVGSSNSRRTSRWSPNEPATTSPHSTSTMPSDSSSSASARSATSCWVVEPVDVGVVQGDPAGGIAVHEGERRRRDRLGHPEGPPEALGERRLAGAHLAGQHDQVAAARQPASAAAMADVDASESERRCNMTADDARGSRRVYRRSIRDEMPQTIS